MKKIISIALASLLLLGALASCTEDEPIDTSAPSDTASEETAEQKNGVVVFEKGVATDYKIYFPYGLDGMARSALSGLTYQIEHKYSIERIPCTAYHLNMPPAVTPHEILIGDLSRPETYQTQALIKDLDNGYAIKLFDNGNIAIVGTDNDQLANGINYFLSTFIVSVSGNKLLLDEGYTYVKDMGETPKGEWVIEAPEYEGGVLARKVYNTGSNISFSAGAAGGKMQLISETNAEEFENYLKVLAENGYKQIVRTENNKNIYLQFEKGGKTLYTYYVDYYKEVRVIDDTSSDIETDFEYTYEAKEGETTVYYQYGMMHDPLGAGEGQNCKSKWGNNGAFDIIKLADNKLILIDGGSSNQVNADTAAALVEFLHEITGTEAGEQITVAAWFLTHPHGDHYEFVNYLTAHYSDEIYFERMMHNIQSGGSGGMGNIASAIMKQNPDVKYLKLHTGQSITLGNITVDVIMTHEDAVNPVTGKTFIIDENNTSTVLKFHLDGKTLMYFGDWGGNDQGTIQQQKEYTEMQNRLLNPYVLEDGSNPTLKSDMVQIAHHGINDWMSGVYNAVDPDYAFFSQADVKYSNLFYICYKNIINQLRKTGTEDKHMYFAGRQTNWLTIEQDGTVTHGHKKIGGAPEEYWEYLKDIEPFWPENNT